MSDSDISKPKPGSWGARSPLPAQPHIIYQMYRDAGSPDMLQFCRQNNWSTDAGDVYLIGNVISVIADQERQYHTTISQRVKIRGTHSTVAKLTEYLLLGKSMREVAALTGMNVSRLQRLKAGTSTFMYHEVMIIRRTINPTFLLNKIDEESFMEEETGMPWKSKLQESAVTALKELAPLKDRVEFEFKHGHPMEGYRPIHHELIARYGDRPFNSRVLETIPPIDITPAAHHAETVKSMYVPRPQEKHQINKVTTPKAVEELHQNLNVEDIVGVPQLKAPQSQEDMERAERIRKFNEAQRAYELEQESDPETLALEEEQLAALNKQLKKEGLI